VRKLLELRAIEDPKDVPFFRKRWYVTVKASPEVQEHPDHEHTWMLWCVRRMVRAARAATDLDIDAQAIMLYLEAREDGW